jgi:hypothetical protein
VAGIGTAFLSSQGIILVAQVSIVTYLEEEVPLFFSYESLNARNQEKLLLTSYLQGPNFKGSSAKHHIPFSRN